MSATPNPNYRVEHVAETPRGWHVRTKMMATHMLRIAFPPGPRRKGSGKVVEIFHPANENPCAMRNPASFRETLTQGTRSVVISKDAEGAYFHTYPYVNSGETAVKSLGSFRKLETARTKARMWLSGGGRNPVEYRSQLPTKSTHEDLMRVMVNRLREDYDRMRSSGYSHADALAQTLRRSTAGPAAIAQFKKAIKSENPAKPFDHRRTQTRRDLARFVRQHPKKQRKEIVSQFPYYRRTNPDETGQADHLYREFHGKDPREILEMQESDAARKTYTALGDLQELVIEAPAGKVKIGFSSGDAVKVASAPGGKQLYLLGGNQNLDSQLDRFGSDAGKDFVELGEAAQITYRARKSIDKFQVVDYYHNLGEETGEAPIAFYDRLKRRIFLVGGRYRVEAPGIIN